MQAFLEGASAGGQSADLQDAITVLEYLANEGNKVAVQRLTDVKEFSNQVLLPSDGTVGQSKGAPKTTSSRPQDDVSPVSVTEDSRTGGTEEGGDDLGNAHRATSRTAAETPAGLLETDLMGDVDFELDWDTAGIFSSFHDPRLPVTGVDHMDWEEMERMFAARDP